MNVSRILILVMIGLACTPLALSQAPASQSADTSQAPAATDQTAGAPDNQADQGEPEDQEPGGKSQPPPGAGRGLSVSDVFSPVFGEGRSFVAPAAQFSTYANSNPGSTPGHTYIDGESVATGTLDLRVVRTGAEMNLVYAGGEFFQFGPHFLATNGKQASDYGTFHSLVAMESFDWHRWTLQIADQFSYLPESAFGFYGFSGLDTYGLNLGGGSFGASGMALGGGTMAYSPLLNGAIQPNQTILNGYGRRMSNSVVTELEYRRGRSGITTAAVYGTLDFLDAGFIDSNALTLFAGYNYSLTRRDIIAITGTYSDFRFSGFFPGVINRGANLTYGHKLSRRLYLNMGAGPVLSTTFTPGVGNANTTIWSTYDSLEYRLAKGSLELSYSRSPTTGSGVLLGAENDWVSLLAQRELSHSTRAVLYLGYAHNSTLQKATAGNQESEFNTWNAGLTVSRNFTDRVNGYVYGNVLQQITNLSERNVFGYVVGVGVNWHGRPHELR